MGVGEECRYEVQRPFCFVVEVKDESPVGLCTDNRALSITTALRYRKDTFRTAVEDRISRYGRQNVR